MLQKNYSIKFGALMVKIQLNLLALPLNATIYQTFIGH